MLLTITYPEFSLFAWRSE